MEKLITNKKGLSALMTIMITVILSILAMILYFAFTRATLSISMDPAIAACQESATLVGATQIPDIAAVAPGTKSSYLSFKCPITAVTIKSSDISPKVPDAKLLELDYSIGQQKKYNLDKIMWTQVSNCLQKVNFGVLPLFDRNKFDGDVPTYCVVCSVVSFDPSVISDLKANLFDISPWIAKRNVTGYSKTVAELLSSRKDAKTDSGLIWWRYGVTQNQAIVYFRTQPSSIQRLFESLTIANTQIGEMPGPLPVLRYFPGFSVGVALGNAWSDTKPEGIDVLDHDGIFIVDYENKGSLDGRCQIIGNEKYLESKI